MAFQTNYNSYQDPALAGMKADIGFDDCVTGHSDDRANDGHFVTLGANSQSIKQPAAADDVTNLQKARGIVLRSLARTVSAADRDLPAGYPANEAVSVMRRGRVWVVVEDAIVVGTSGVHVRVAGTGNKGAFRGAAVANETAQLADVVAKWVIGTTGPGLAQLEINL